MGTLTIRTDSEVERALQSLTRDGRSRSEVARSAILEAERAQRRERLRAEAESLRDDPDDVAAARELAAEMDAIRGGGSGLTTDEFGVRAGSVPVNREPRT